MANADDDDSHCKEYQELVVDGWFTWNKKSTNILLYCIAYIKGEFLKLRMEPFNNKEISLLWEETCEKVIDCGVKVNSLNCQRKWFNLLEGYIHHNSMLEKRNTLPTWEYFEQLQDLTKEVNIAVTVGVSVTMKDPDVYTKDPEYYNKLLTEHSLKETAIGKLREHKGLETEPDLSFPFLSDIERQLVRENLNTVQEFMDVDKHKKMELEQMRINDEIISLLKGCNERLAGIFKQDRPEEVKITINSNTVEWSDLMVTGDMMDIPCNNEVKIEKIF